MGAAQIQLPVRIISKFNLSQKLKLVFNIRWQSCKWRHKKYLGINNDK